MNAQVVVVPSILHQSAMRVVEWCEQLGVARRELMRASSGVPFSTFTGAATLARRRVSWAGCWTLNWRCCDIAERQRVSDRCRQSGVQTLSTVI